MVTSELQDNAAIASFLKQKVVSNAYPLGYLAPDYSDQCRWLAASDPHGIRALALVYDGLSRPGLFTAGDTDGLLAILDRFGRELPTRVTAHLPVEHDGVVRNLYRPPTPLRRMHRMGLRREALRDNTPDDPRVVRLTHADTAAILQLYALWPDHFFEPYQLGGGLYFGVKEGNRLVSIAGIHNVSTIGDVAAIGNLVTHPDARGRGYALLCTSRLLREVFSRVSLVTLDVEVGNEPAIRTYRHFGFYHDSDLLEGELHRT